MDPFIGEIIMFAGNFAPRGWALCDGQLMSISQYSALFSILGTTYGGDGVSTFGLPDLRSRVPVHAGHGPGLSTVRLGEKSGQENVTLTAIQMPSHNHTMGSAAPRTTIKASSADADSGGPAGAVLAASSEDSFNTSATDVELKSDSAATTFAGPTDNNGGSQSHNNRQPYQAVNFIIALVGTYPSRS